MTYSATSSSFVSPDGKNQNGISTLGPRPRLTGTEKEKVFRFQKSMKCHRFFSDLCSLKICSLFHVSKPENCSSPSWEIFRPVHAMTRTHVAVMDMMDFEESFLRNSNAAYYNSPHNQILPSKWVFWLHNVKTF